MKKFVSQMLAVCMACTMFNVLPAKAETEELYPDYVPSTEMPENLLGKFDMTAEREWCNTTSRNSTAVCVPMNPAPPVITIFRFILKFSE